MYYVVKYTGVFGFIKPWSAVRDGLTYSQQFLTPSIIEGMEKKLFPDMLHKNGAIEHIARHKLQYCELSEQNEVAQPRGLTKIKKISKTESLITHGNYKNSKINFPPITRGVMIYPVLYLAFNSGNDARIASTQHLCLCRNEDIVLPEEQILEMSENEFDNLNGFELRFGESSTSFPVGYSRYDRVMKTGWIEFNGKSLS